MKKVLTIALLLLLVLTVQVFSDELINRVRDIEHEIIAVTAKYEGLVASLPADQPKVMLAGFGCTPDKPKEPPMEVKPIAPPSPPTDIQVTVTPSEKPKVKKPAVVKVTRKGNEWTIKLNTNKLKKGEEVHLCVGYMYFNAGADQVSKDGTVKIKTSWTPPGNPRVSAGVWNGHGQYVTSALVTVGG